MRQNAMYDVLCGTALGDAAGWPLEFLKDWDIRNLRRELGDDFYDYIGAKGRFQYTDDTQMSIAAARAIVQGTDDMTALMRNLWASYQTWYLTQQIPGQSRAPGLTCMRSLQGGIPGSLENRINDSRGNGTVMRAGVFGCIDDREFGSLVAFHDALMTHGDINAAYASSIQASLINILIENGRDETNIFGAINNGYNLMNGLRPEFVVELTAIERCNGVVSRRQASDAINRILRTPGWFYGTADTTLVIALYAFMGSTNLDEALELCLYNSGDSDTYGAVVGAMYGALGQAKSNVYTIDNFSESDRAALEEFNEGA